MIVNIRIDISDTHRNLVARKLAGKPVKRMITRKEVNELVDGFINSLTSEIGAEHVSKWGANGFEHDTVQPEPVDLSRVPEKYADKSDAWKVGWLRGWDSVGQRIGRPS